jgi:Predicted periplasmic lipoprotein (DUF2279)
MTKLIFFFLLTITASMQSGAQDTVNYKKRLNIVRFGGLAGYTIGMVGLDLLWYSKSPRSSFTIFNDAAEWKQMDKAGHLFSAFHVSNFTNHALRWAGSKERRRSFMSAAVGFGLISSIEFFDGFSPDYGASISDLGANAAGSLLFLGQMVAWREIRIQPKFSFHETSFAPKNPDLLGANLSEQIFKDYNGQTYWLSVDMDKFIRFPKWLNLAGGYGASNMVNARDSQNLEPVRQFYFSLDLDLKAIPTKSKFLKAVIFLVDMVKIPAPTLEFSKDGIKVHALYF